VAFQESRHRSLIKSITFRLLVVITDIVVVYMLTGSYKVVTAVVILTNITSTLIYYAHERAWNNIHLGKYKKR